MPQTFVLPRQVVLEDGSAAAGATASFFRTGTDTPQSVFLDVALQAATVRVTADSAGVLQKFYLDPYAPFDYRVRIEAADGRQISQDDDIPSGISESELSNVLTQSFLAQLLYPQTQAEDDAAVTPTVYTLPEGYLSRYGAVGDGATDDSAAFARAALVAAQGVQIIGDPKATYRLDSDVSLSDVFLFDGRGCTIKFVTASRFVSHPPNGDVTTTVSSGGTQGNAQVVVASGTSLAVGQDVVIEASNFPRHWAKLKAIAGGTTVTIDRALPLTLSGTINFFAYNPGTLRDRCLIENVVFDGSLTNTASADNGQVARIGGFRDARVRGCRFTNYSIADECVLLQVYRCIDVHVTDNTLTGFVLQDASNVIDVQECRSALITGNVIHGSAFGVNITRCALATVTGNTLSGGFAWETVQAISPEYSIRGIKCTSCADVTIGQNVVSDYANPIRIDMGYRYSIVGNTVRNAGWKAAYTGDIAVNATATDFAAQFGNVIANNVIEYCGGEGIGVDNGATNGNGRTVIAGNVIRHCNGYGIYANDRDCTVANNIIQDWDIVAGGRFGIWYSSGANITGNRFHNTDATRVCLRTFLDTGFKYVFRDNVAVDGNPMFAGPLEAETSGTATIASGATTVAVTHGSIYTPALHELTIIPGENATNDWGKWNVESIGATTFTIRVGADPGASNLDIGWRFSPQFPRTA